MRQGQTYRLLEITTKEYTEIYLGGTLLLWPQCAVCEKSVEELRRLPDFANSDFIVEARCHGSVDRTVVDRRDLEEGPVDLYGGTAFIDETITDN